MVWRKFYPVDFSDYINFLLIYYVLVIFSLKGEYPYSAGIEKRGIDPKAVRAMSEAENRHI